MNAKIVKVKDQARGAFDFGRIQENKPIGFPHEGGVSKPISNLFYWAHAWSDDGGLIAEHPHQGFEIMSYVIRGELSHYDNKNDEWKSLTAGDAQLIKAGNGISHAEKFLPSADIFQIWFDPDLRKTLGVPASYIDYNHDDFNVSNDKGYQVKLIAGENGLMDLDTEGVEINEIQSNQGIIDINLSLNHKSLFYVIYGSLKIENEVLKRDDLLIVSDTDSLKLNVTEKAKLFQISVPLKLSYQTYAETQRM